MIINIISKAEGISLQELKNSLEIDFSRQKIEIPLNISHSDTSLRGVDPTILSAAIGASGALLGSLITGILQIILKEKMTVKTIIIVTPSGAKIEVPVNTPDEEIDRVIERLKKLDEKKIGIIMYNE